MKYLQVIKGLEVFFCESLSASMQKGGFTKCLRIILLPFYRNTDIMYINRESFIKYLKGLQMRGKEYDDRGIVRGKRIITLSVIQDKRSALGNFVRYLLREDKI